MQREQQNSRDSLSVILVQIETQKDSLHDALTFEQGSTHALLITQDRLQNRLDELQLQIDQQGQNASLTQQQLNSNLRQKNEEIEQRQTRLEGIQALLDQRTQRLTTIAEELDTLFQDLPEGWSTRQRNGQLYLAINEVKLFRNGSTSRLTGEGEELLAGIARIILRYPEMELLIAGHTDNQPIARQSLDNWQYSALRAVSVTKFLMEHDIGANRMLAASKSEFQPLESNESEEGRASNRRVEIIISPAVANFQRKLERFLKE